ncbi:Alpha/beta hydrolase family protein [Amycolatopsis rubida]|uniref:Alpha/beta hydrolase family protein n=1 Tax=Amycolatopsis rubida TaxID=112413 RepID=A0A1I5NUQ5_9PSEU|nr:Alpha/beta hydrolase family protein [Amycolatopsis rubida]
MAELVLVHGAWSDGSAWPEVIPALHRHGHRVRSAHLPMTSLADDIAEVRREIATFGGPVVLAGHSYGGAVISGAAKDNPQVNALAYFAAYVPDEGENVPSQNGKFPGWPSNGPPRWPRCNDALAPAASPHPRVLVPGATCRRLTQCPQRTGSSTRTCSAGSPNGLGRIVSS